MRRPRGAIGLVLTLVICSSAMTRAMGMPAFSWNMPFTAPPLCKSSPMRARCPPIRHSVCSPFEGTLRELRSRHLCIPTQIRRTCVSSQVSMSDAGGSKDLHVYVFCTIVGWGKNVFLETLSTMEEEDLKSRLGDIPRVLESDVIGGKKFWPEVGKTIQNKTLGSHLFLNKNFPSNSWEGAKRRLEEFCKANNRNLILHAIVPSSPGTERNPFALLDLAVCLEGVQGRTGHPNLDSTSDYAAAVAASFYAFYNHPGGRKGFLESLSKKLTDKVIVLEWMDQEVYAACPPKINTQMVDLLRRARRCSNTRDASTEGLRKQLDQDLRSFYAQEDVKELISRCRLPKDAIANAFLSAIETSC